MEVENHFSYSLTVKSLNKSLRRAVGGGGFWRSIYLVLLLLATDVVSQTPDKMKAHVDAKALRSENGKWSVALQKLFRQAQDGSSVPIRVTTYSPRPSNPASFQGQTRGYDSDEIEIHVASGVSKSYDESLLAHELFHVVLHNKGFNPGVKLAPGYVIPGLSTTDSDRNLAPIGTWVNSCFPDELIDRETAKRGFTPFLLTELEAKETLTGLQQLVDQRISISDDLAQKGNAVNLFCLGLRRPSSIEAIDKLSAALSPEILRTEKALRRKFAGDRCHFDDAKHCYALTVLLRDAAGFKGMIALKNPSTFKWE